MYVGATSGVARPKTVCKQWKKHPTKYTKYFHSFTPAAKVFSIPCWDYLCASTQNSFLSWLRDFLRLFIMITIPRSQHNTFHVRSFSLYLKLTCRFPINTISPSPLTFQNSRVHGWKRTKYQIKFPRNQLFGPTDPWEVGPIDLLPFVRPSVRPSVRSFVCYQLSSETNHRISLIFCIKLAFSKSKKVTKPEFQKY